MIEEKEMSREIATVNADAMSIVVTDNASYLLAGEMLSAIKRLKKNIEEYFKPLKSSAHNAWKQICTRESEEIAKLTPAIDHIDKQMTTWNIEQERLRQEEEARLRREAERVAEERLLQAALEAEKTGDKEEAEAILNEPIFVPPPIVEKSVPKIAGQTMITTWEAEIVDANLIPREYLVPDMVKINQVVRAMKEKTDIAGIRAVPKSSMRGVRK